MTIKIVLPNGNKARPANGTMVFTEDGREINGISGITVTLMPNEMIMATIDVEVSSIENFEGIEAFVNIIKPEAIDE